MWDPRTSIVLDVSQRGQEIERKRQVARNQVSKKSKKGKVYRTKRLTYCTQFAAASSTFQRRWSSKEKGK
jgi:hypothetical protein